MSRPRVVSPIPTGCIRAGQYDRRHLCCPLLSQQTHSVAGVSLPPPLPSTVPTPRSAPTVVGDRGEDPAINRRSRRLARSGDVGMRRSPDGVRVQHCAARCGHNCGHPVASERPAWSVIRDPRTAQPCHPSVDLQRNQSSHGAAGGGASSALSSCLSSKSEHEHRGVERWVASTFSHRDLNFSDMYAEIFAERRRHCDVINSFGFT